MIDLDDAVKITAAARAESRRLGVPPMTIVVTDRGGVIRAAIREPGYNLFGIDLATAKARTALGFGRSTLEMALSPGNTAPRAAGLSGASGGQFIPIGGGVILLDAAGNFVGAAAASGAPHETDHAIILHAIAEAGLTTLPMPGLPAA